MMRKDWMCAALLAAGIACAHAEETTWQFSYQGFVDVATGQFLPNQTLSGSFTGTDGNADGLITVDELTYLDAGNYNYLAPGGGGCVDSTSPYISCSITGFTTAAGTAKPMPTLPPLGETMAVLTPITRPCRSKVGPPELPELIGASICRKSS